MEIANLLMSVTKLTKKSKPLRVFLKALIQEIGDDDSKEEAFTDMNVIEKIEYVTGQLRALHNDGN
jgi:hypothetical protein